MPSVSAKASSFVRGLLAARAAWLTSRLEPSRPKLSCVPAATMKDSASSRAEPKRAFGSRARAFTIHASISGDSFASGAASVGGGIAPARIFPMSGPSASAEKGRTPVRHSKTTTPIAQRSVRWSTLFSPCACSGLM